MTAMRFATRCPECSSINTAWLKEASRAAAVDYFRYRACGAVWVVGHDPDSTHSITVRESTGHGVANFFDVGLKFLYTDLEAGLLFAEMAQAARARNDVTRCRELRSKARRAYKAVLKFMPKISIAPDDERRLLERLEVLRGEIQAVAA